MYYKVTREQHKDKKKKKITETSLNSCIFIHQNMKEPNVSGFYQCLLSGFTTFLTITKDQVTIQGLQGLYWSKKGIHI